MISDAEYDDWLTYRNRDPVYLVEVQAKDSEDNDVTIRASDRRYVIEDNAYRARLFEMESLWQLESGLFSETHTDTSTMRLINNDSRLDSWKDLRLLTVKSYRGDRSWPLSDFRVVFDGEVYSRSVDHGQITLTVASKTNRLNVTVKDGDFTFNGGGQPGAVAKSYLTDSMGGLFSDSDLFLASFTETDTNYPYTIDVDPDATKENYLSLVDRAFSGLPLDLCVNKRGLFFVAEFKKPAGTTAFSTFLPTNRPEIEIVPPLGEVTVNNTTSVDTHETFTESTTVKSGWPNEWRSLSVETEFVDPMTKVADTEALADDILALYDSEYDRIRFDTQRDLSNLNLGDEIFIKFDRYGYQDGRYGIVTLMRERLSGINTIEAWVL